MEQLKPHEKIQLASNQLVFMANNLNHLKLNLIQVKQSSTFPEIHQDTIDDIDSILEELSEKMVMGMNEMADYMNEIDATTELDCKLFNPIVEELNRK